jgi:hypothetical protein
VEAEAAIDRLRALTAAKMSPAKPFCPAMPFLEVAFAGTAHATRDLGRPVIGRMAGGGL